MANISTANGELTIIAECDKKEFRKFQTALNEYLQRGEYGADFYETDKFQFENGKCETTVGFHGWGRWTFDENLRRFFIAWADYYSANSNELNLKFLMPFSFKLIFDFVDYEEGQQLLYTEKASIEHKANAPWKETSFEVLSYEDIEFTADNLIDYGAVDDDELIEVTDVSNLREFLDNEADDISDSELETYAKNHRGEILHSWEMSDVIDEIKG